MTITTFITESTMRCSVGISMSSAFVFLCAGCTAGEIDLGKLDQKDPPALKDLKGPKDDKEVTNVGLSVSVEGKINENEKANIYVLVNPLSNPDTRNLWWVQRPVRRNGSVFSGACQFGEGPQGEGEYFAILAIATEKDLDIGQTLSGVPKEVLCTKLRIVKRSN